ncbi:MAG: hypothetical protein K2O22_04795 [Anaeroplasmataceae bacterium]|nr:hypothetical protein [Anaeroplasmataceae bacterium]
MRKIEIKYTGTNDQIFKNIFNNPKILSSYLKLLDIDIHPEEIVYENVEGDKDVRFKSVRFDIRIKASHTRIDIESQRQKISGVDCEDRKVDWKTYQTRRKIHYLCVLHSKAYDKGETYHEGRQSKVIFFLDYDVEGEDSIQRTKLVNTSTKEAYEEVEIIEVFLGKRREDDTIEGRMFNVLTRKDITKYYGEEGIVGGVAKMIFELNADERLKNRIQYEEDMRREEAGLLKGSYDEGYYRGQEKGQKKAKFETAKRLKSMGLSDEMISEGTGLSLKEVKKLK